VLALLFVFGIQASGLDTGTQSPTLDSGNFTSSSNAFADGNPVARFRANDSHQYFGYNFVFGLNPIIEGIEIRVDAQSDNGKQATLNIELSWDGGSSFTSTGRNTGVMPTSENTFTFGGPTDTWGRTWAESELTSNNFRVRLNSASSDNNRVGRLDWLPVTVYFSNGPAVNISVTGINNLASITETEIMNGELSLTRTFDVTISALVDHTVSVRLEGILVNGLPSSITATAFSLSANASGQAGTSNVTIDPFVALGLGVDISNAFSGLAGATNEISQIDTTINLNQLGDRAITESLTFNLTFIVTEFP